MFKLMTVKPLVYLLIDIFRYTSKALYLMLQHHDHLIGSLLFFELDIMVKLLLSCTDI